MALVPKDVSKHCGTKEENTSECWADSSHIEHSLPQEIWVSGHQTGVTSTLLKRQRNQYLERPQVCKDSDGHVQALISILNLFFCLPYFHLWPAGRGRGSCPSALRCDTSPGALRPQAECSAQQRRGPVGERPEEGRTKDQGWSSSLRGQAERAGAVQPGQGKAEGDLGAACLYLL